MSELTKLLLSRRADAPRPNGARRIVRQHSTARQCTFSAKSALVDAAGIDTRRMSVGCVVSTEDPDRENDVIVTAGIDTSLHQKNPCVLLNHGLGAQDMPVAQAQDPEGRYTVVAQPRMLRAVSWFTNSVQESEQVFHLITSGLLRGVSIGFNALEGERRRGPGGDGLLITRSEMFEYSHAPVGVNPYALADATVGKSICGKMVSPKILKALSPYLPRLKEQVAGGWEGGAKPEAKPSAKLPEPIARVVSALESTERLLRELRESLCQDTGGLGGEDWAGEERSAKVGEVLGTVRDGMGVLADTHAENAAEEREMRKRRSLLAGR